MDKKNVIIGILCGIVVVLVVSFWVSSYNRNLTDKMNEINRTAYDTGFRDGTLNLYSQQLSSLNTNQLINFPYQYINQTTNKTESINIRMIPESVCQGYINQVRGK